MYIGMLGFVYLCGTVAVRQRALQSCRRGIGVFTSAQAFAVGHWQTSMLGTATENTANCSLTADFSCTEPKHAEGQPHA